MPFGLGIWEIVILLGVLALLFGAKGVPQVARRLGTGVREVKDAVAEVDPRRMLEAGDETDGRSQAADRANRRRRRVGRRRDARHHLSTTPTRAPAPRTTLVPR